MESSTETIRNAYKGSVKHAKSEAIAPKWMLRSTEAVMQYYLDRYLTLDPCVLEKFPLPQPGHSYMLYAHIPFCKTLCSYCTFHRFLFKEYKAREYFVNLRKEMQAVHDMGYDFTSMYVGGGTTTVLMDELAKTLEMAKKLFPSIKEISVETDPQIMGDPQIGLLKGLVDRMSIGVQSFNDDILKMTERDKFGTGQEVFENIAKAQELFPICNVDMIFGFHGQTDEILRNDLETLLKLSPRQITTYPLMVTSQTKRSVKDTIAAPPEIMAGQYRMILDTLTKTDYNQLSSWAFGKSNNEGFDEYVIDNDEYLGIGSGAFSFLGDSLYVNTFSLRRYNERIGSGDNGVERKRTFNKQSILQYRLLLGLFAGRLSRKYFERVHGVKLDRALFKEIAALKIAGAIKENPDDPDQFIVTDRGKLLGLVMMKDFYSAMDNVRAELRKPLKEADM